MLPGMTGWKNGDNNRNVDGTRTTNTWKHANIYAKKLYAYDVNVVAVSWWNHYAGIPIKFAAEFGRSKVVRRFSPRMYALRMYVCWLLVLSCIDCIASKTTLHLPIAFANGKSFFPPVPSIMFSILYSALFFTSNRSRCLFGWIEKVFNAKKVLMKWGKKWEKADNALCQMMEILIWLRFLWLLYVCVNFTRLWLFSVRLFGFSFFSLVLSVMF